jgi:outer membrane protein assembly factor BamB
MLSRPTFTMKSIRFSFFWQDLPCTGLGIVLSCLVVLIGFGSGCFAGSLLADQTTVAGSGPAEAGAEPRDDSRWPQWRGSRWDSISPATNLPADLNAEGVRQWRVELPGPAGSSPIVWEDKIFLTSIDGDQSGDAMLLICLNTAGEKLWSRKLDGQNINFRDNANLASPSPMTDGQHVWAQMANGILHCFTLDGELVWKKDLQQVYGRFDIQFGMSSTPLLDNSKIYLQLIHGNMRDQRLTSDGHVIALEAGTGEQVWHHRRLTDGYAENLHAYCSPTIYRDQDREFLIVHGADYVTGHSLEDGSEIWRCGGFNIRGADYNPYLRFVASPTAVPGMIVVPTAKRGPVVALRPDLQGDVTEQSDSQLWRINGGTPDVASPLIYQGLVYLADERGVLICLNADSGEILYQQRLLSSNHRSTPVGVDGKVFLTGRDGEVVVLQAGSEFKLLSKLELKEEMTASPAIANGQVLIRTFQALYSFSNPK